MIDQALAETDEMLDRFRALQRIGEIERRNRQAFFEPLRLEGVMQHVMELHEPLAEERGVALEMEVAPNAPAVSRRPGAAFRGGEQPRGQRAEVHAARRRVRLRLTARTWGRGSR